MPSWYKSFSYISNYYKSFCSFYKNLSWQILDSKEKKRPFFPTEIGKKNILILAGPPSYWRAECNYHYYRDTPRSRSRVSRQKWQVQLPRLQPGQNEPGICSNIWPKVSIKSGSLNNSLKKKKKMEVGWRVSVQESDDKTAFFFF